MGYFVRAARRAGLPWGAKRQSKVAQRLWVEVRFGSTVLLAERRRPPQGLSFCDRPDEGAAEDCVCVDEAAFETLTRVVRVAPRSRVAEVVVWRDGAFWLCADPSAKTGVALGDTRLDVGDRMTVELGALTVTLEIEPRAPAPLARSLSMRMAAFAAGSALLHGLVLAGAATADPVPREPGLTPEQIEWLRSAYPVRAEPFIPIESEGAMGNRYGVRGPPDPTKELSPSSGDRSAALADAAEFGMIGILNSGAGGPTDPWGGQGHGNGGGGIGLGSVGTIGHGAGASSGNMWGAPIGGAYGAGASSHAPTIDRRPPPNRDGRYATTYRPGRGHLASFDAAVQQGIVPKGLSPLVGDLGATYAPKLAAPTEHAIRMVADVERAELPPGGGRAHVRIALRSAGAEGLVRMPLRLVVALDRSGSMEGTVMEQARRSVRELVDRLDPWDQVSLVTFGSEVRVALPLGSATNRKREVQKAVDETEALGSTHFEGALATAYDQLKREPCAKTVSCLVLVVSDGRPTVGSTDHGVLADRAVDAFHRGIQTSTFGLGLDFDGALMARLSQDGAGGFYYVAQPEALTRALTTELDKRLAPAAVGVELRVVLADDVNPVRVYGSGQLTEKQADTVRQQEVTIDQREAAVRGIAQDRQSDEKRGMRFFMPSFGKDDQHVLLLEVDVPPGVEERSIATVHLSAKDRIRGANLVDKAAIRVGFAANDAASASTINESVARTRVGFAAGDALTRAATLADWGQLDAARQIVSEHHGLLLAASNRFGDAGLTHDAERLRALDHLLAQGTLDARASRIVLAAAATSRLR